MDIADIDAIAAPDDPGEHSDFELMRAVVRRHVLEEGNWLTHRELANALERRHAAALVDGERLTVDSRVAQQKRRAYSALLAALNHFCALTCARPL